jgi:hypothetical protein
MQERARTKSIYKGVGGTIDPAYTITFGNNYPEIYAGDVEPN